MIRKNYSLPKDNHQNDILFSNKNLLYFQLLNFQKLFSSRRKILYDNFLLKEYIYEINH